MKQRYMVYVILTVWLCVAIGCGGDSGSNIGDGGGKGTLTLSLTDAPAERWRAVYVSIESIEICLPEPETDATPDAPDDCLWQMIARPAATYNLLELVNGVSELLGSAELPVGAYRHLRLMIDTLPDEGINRFAQPHPHANYLVDAEEKPYPMDVPSGIQSGVKLTGEFVVDENRDTELILDFDAHRSIVSAGRNEKYILKPVIKVMDIKNLRRLSGVVHEVRGANEIPLPAVTVSAQRKDEPSGWVVAGTTLTDDTGGYQLLLPKNGEYTIVVFSDSHKPACDVIGISAADQSYTRDFSLEAAERAVTVQGTVTGVADGRDVHLSFRQGNMGCGDGGQETELASAEVAYQEGEGFAYAVTLPVGEGYRVVYTDGVNEASEIFDVGAETRTLNLEF